jgi:putative peptidoglycan lipid II flippase
MDQTPPKPDEWSQGMPFDDGNPRYQGLEFLPSSQSFRVDDVRAEIARRELMESGNVTKPLGADALSLDIDPQQSQDLTAKVQAVIAKQGTSVSGAALLLTSASFVSRFLGLLRGSLFSHIGTNQFTDAYTQAFNLPDLVYNVVAGGALVSAFIPVFNLYMMGKKDEKTAWHVASSALNISTVFLMFLALLGMLFTPQIIHIYYFTTPVSEQGTIVSLMRIMFLQSVIMGAGVIISSVLNARGNFVLPAIGSILYPIGMIIGLIPSFLLKQSVSHSTSAIDYTTVYYASWGVVLGAALMVAVQIPGLWKVGMEYRPVFDWSHPGFRQMVRQMIPRMANALMITMSQYVDILLISVLIAYVNLPGLQIQYRNAFTIVSIPLGVITPLATASFPRMAEYAAESRLNELRTLIIESLQSVIFIALPSCLGMVMLSLPLVQVLYEHGQFTLSDAQSTAIPLICYAFGLPGLALVEILTRPFYAMRQSRLPVFISLMQLGLKIALSIVLLNPSVWLAQTVLGSLFPTVLNPLLLSVAWGMGALALGTAISSLLEAMALLWVLHNQLGGLRPRALIVFTGKVLIAMAVLIVVLGGSYHGLGLILQTPDYGGALSMPISGSVIVGIKLLISGMLGGFAYLRTSRYLHLLGGTELRPVNRLLTRLHLAWI